MPLAVAEKRLHARDLGIRRQLALPFDRHRERHGEAIAQVRARQAPRLHVFLLFQLDLVLGTVAVLQVAEVDVEFGIVRDLGAGFQPFGLARVNPTDPVN